MKSSYRGRCHSSPSRLLTSHTKCLPLRLAGVFNEKVFDIILSIFDVVLVGVVVTAASAVRSFCFTRSCARSFFPLHLAFVRFFFCLFDMISSVMLNKWRHAVDYRRFPWCYHRLEACFRFINEVFLFYSHTHTKPKHTQRKASEAAAEVEA